MSTHSDVMVPNAGLNTVGGCVGGMLLADMAEFVNHREVRGHGCAFGG